MINMMIKVTTMIALIKFQKRAVPFYHNATSQFDSMRQYISNVRHRGLQKVIGHIRTSHFIAWRNCYKGTFMCFSLKHRYCTGILDNTQDCARKVSIALKIRHFCNADTYNQCQTIIRCQVCASSAVKWFSCRGKKPHEL